MGVNYKAVRAALVEAGVIVGRFDRRGPAWVGARLRADSIGRCLTLIVH